MSLRRQCNLMMDLSKYLTDEKLLSFITSKDSYIYNYLNLIPYIYIYIYESFYLSKNIYMRVCNQA